MISIWPSVGNDTELARELDAKGLRFEPLHWISKKARIYDAFSPEGRAIYFKHIKKGLLDVGVDALWMDGTEVEVGGACHDPAEVEADIKSLGRNAMGDFTRYLNPYSLVTTKGTYEGQRAATGDKRVFTLTRSAWAGQQRYAALSWSGDTTAELGDAARADRRRPQRRHGRPALLDAGHRRLLRRTTRRARRNPDYRELFARWNQFGDLQSRSTASTAPTSSASPTSSRTLDPEVYGSLRRAARAALRGCCPTSTAWPGEHARAATR